MVLFCTHHEPTHARGIVEQKKWSCSVMIWVHISTYGNLFFMSIYPCVLDIQRRIIIIHNTHTEHIVCVCVALCLLKKKARQNSRHLHFQNAFMLASYAYHRVSKIIYPRVSEYWIIYSTLLRAACLCQRYKLARMFFALAHFFWQHFFVRIFIFFFG